VRLTGPARLGWTAVLLRELAPVVPAEVLQCTKQAWSLALVSAVVPNVGDSARKPGGMVSDRETSSKLRDGGGAFSLRMGLGLGVRFRSTDFLRVPVRFIVGSISVARVIFARYLRHGRIFGGGVMGPVRRIGDRDAAQHSREQQAGKHAADWPMEGSSHRLDEVMHGKSVPRLG
jgi:hypothetical protein